jgi:hypothetical protein
LNVFAYAKQNPVKYFDPDGKANTPVHDYLTRLVALQYVDKKTAIDVGRAANTPDTDPKYGSEKNSFMGDIDRVNQDIHALGKGERETKVKAILEGYSKRNTDKMSSFEKIQDAGIYMLHPIQDASYHLPGVSEGPGLGHLLFPEADLAVGDKSFEEFHQVIKDTEKGIELMKEKGIIEGDPGAKKMSEAEWKEVYNDLKKIENKYKDDFLKLNVLGIAGTIAGKIAGMFGGMIGGIIGGMVGFVIALFSGKNVVEGAKEGFRMGTNLGQLILGAPAVAVAGFGTIALKNDLRNQVADEQSNYLQQKFNISDSQDKIVKMEPAHNLNYDLVLK